MNTDETFILLVDDDPTTLEVLATLLSSFGVEIAVATDGQMALDQASCDPPDLILLDVWMPGIDGFEVCRRLKESEATSDIPVIFMTALVDTADKVRGLGLGAVDYITKPFQQEEVLARIRTHLKLRDLTRRLSEKNALLEGEIKERIAAEASLEKLTRELEARVDARTAELLQAQKMEAIGLLAGGMAHDFNNMLAVITGLATMMERDLTPEHPMLVDLEQINEAADRATALTRQLLAFSRKQILQPQVLNLNALVENLERMLIRLIGEDIEVVTRRASRLGKVMADAGQMEQVVMNLVVNARDAMPRGGVLTLETADVLLDAIALRGHPDMLPGPYVMLAVTDTGLGMDKATQARIFEPFYTTKEKGRGTGLGLSTVYGIVKQSGGHIAVHSEPGRGAAFKVYLPRTEQTSEPAEREAPKPEVLRGTETILIVEDEPLVRSLTCRILERHGYTVVEASTGAVALFLCEQHAAPFHLMLTDIVMPKMSGCELADRAARLRPSMKIIYMSGYREDVCGHPGITPGMVLLEKPFAMEALLSCVRRVLDEPRVVSDERPPSLGD
jgi:DNA-binding response OmpR family regulator